MTLRSVALLPLFGRSQTKSTALSSLVEWLKNRSLSLDSSQRQQFVENLTGLFELSDAAAVLMIV
jgi:hypothetical protein